MKNTKKAITIIVALNVITLNVKAVHDVWGDFWFDFQGTNATVLYLRNSTGSNYSIPQTAFYESNGSYTSYIVNKIANNAFQGKTNITNMTLPESMETIGSSAFSRTHISSMIIPKSVKTFGDTNSFGGCDLLTSLIYMPLQAPTNWVATTNTYVPDKQSYSSPRFSINNAKVTEMISFEQNEFDYTGQSPTPTWTNNINGYTVSSIEMPSLKSNAGTHTDTIPVLFIKNGGGGGFWASVVYRYTIKPAVILVKAKNYRREYGDDNPNFTLSYSGFVNGENESVIISPPTLSTIATKTSDVGEYPITISGGIAQNYTFAYEPGTLTVIKAPLTAKVNDATKQYGTENPAFFVNYTGLKNGETVPQWSSPLQISTSATSSSDVGEYAITATGIPVNYDLPIIGDGTLSITQAPLTIKANDATRMYFEDEPSFSFSCSGFLNGDDVTVLTTTPTITTEAIKTSNVGKYTIIPSGTNAKNYSMSYEQGELTITKRPLTVTSHCSKEYGDDNPLLPIEYLDFVNNETENVITVPPTATTTATIASQVGDYPITLSGGVSTNYNFVYEQGILTITKAPLSAMVNDATKVYGSNNPSFTISFFELKNGETVPAWTTSPTFQTEATKQSGVGQYAVNAINGVPKNYDLGAITPGTLTVTPALLTIKANNATRQYYSENPTFSYTCNGFVNNDNNSVLSSKPTLSTSASVTSGVGTYPIEISGASSPNYSISYQNGTLTIIQRTLTASVGNYQRVYNEDNPEFEVIFNGFVGGDNEDVLITKPVARTSATKTSDVGTYPINVSGGNADNYTFTYTPGILTINKAEQTIKWDQVFGTIMVGDQIELKAEASSGLPITYTVNNSNIAEVYTAGRKTYLDCFGLGEVQILAVQEGNQNYYSSPRARKIVTIDNEDAISNLDESNVKIQGTSYGIRVTGANRGDIIRIYTVDGKLCHTVEADSQAIDIPLEKDGIYIIQVGTKIVKLAL